MPNEILKYILIDKDASIKETIRGIDRRGFGIAFLVDKKKKLFGVVTDGDIRRAILGGINISKRVEEIANTKPIFLAKKPTAKDISDLKNDKKISKCIPPEGSLKIPVVDKEGRVIDVVFLYGDKKKSEGIFKLNQGVGTNGGVKTVLIAGGAGYLGSVLSRKLLAKGYKVKVLDNLTYGEEGIKDLLRHKKFDFVKGDVRNISDVIDALKGADAVINLAAIVGDPACALDPKETIKVNYLATKGVAEACKFNQINKFLFASTCSVYGSSKTPDDQLSELSDLNPVSLYAETKLRSEEGIFSLADENFAPTVFRFATLYGASPRMRFDLVVNTLTAKALAEKKINIFGGNQWRPNIDVSDAAEACLKWVESPIEKTGSQIFNVGENKQNHKIVEIGEMVKKIIPKTEVIIEQDKGDPRDYNVAFDKIADILNFAPQKNVEVGIMEMKKLLAGKRIQNFNDSKYNNYRFLSEGSKGNGFK